MSKSAAKILSTAEQLFNQHSFNAVGVDLIRDESGCSKTTLYTYFKNKQQLVASVLKKRDVQFRQSLCDFVGEAQGLAALEQIFDWHIQWFQQDHFKGCLFVRAAGESSQQDTEILDLAKQHKHWLYGFIAQYAQHLKQPEAVTELCYNFLEGLISRFLVEGFHAEIAEQNKQLMINLIKNLQA
ncbi:TetR/AcrR family transcriptional regulator [Acinetobacter brisouii]|jgi:AcrR family transcriptional regulator|uniref:TetR/AcrR family transcriptional regulator n=1 Tax=Acinetobacter brisouii TaxID=396323 RepID=UPI0005F76DBA|nr:TetR/AcrR family transcriptional regulator [Acinetobacter brisouii]KJV40391.1 TetR family transcriptional regulator [Acinetobacter brisouii]